jgi:glycogen(starch) synthase
MKILMLGWELPPHYVGGMGVVCDQLTKHLARSGADIEFVLPFSADYSSVKHMKVTPAIMQGTEVLMSSGSTYDSMRYSTTLADGTVVANGLYEQVEVFAQNVQKLICYGEYDVIHAHDWLTFKAAMAAKKVTGLPLIAHVHATEFDRAGGKYGNPMVRELEYNGLHAADHIFAVSQRTKDTIVSQYNIDPQNISVSHNHMDIDPALLNETENTFAYIQQLRSQGYQVVVNAGRMTIQKGVFHLLEAAKLVIEQRPKTVFLLSGGGEQIPELLMKASELGIAQNVMFTGWVSGIGKQWRDAFRVADLFVMPSVSEPLGIAPLEAISYGAPAMVTKQSGISEVLKNILKVDYWDTTEMASQICAVLNSKGLRDTLIQNAQAEHASMSWQPIAKKIMDKYHNVRRISALRAGATL